jgi:hypothetical protein
MIDWERFRPLLSQVYRSDTELSGHPHTNVIVLMMSLISVPLCEYISLIASALVLPEIFCERARIYLTSLDSSTQSRCNGFRGQHRVTETRDVAFLWQ